MCEMRPSDVDRSAEQRTYQITIATLDQAALSSIVSTVQGRLLIFDNLFICNINEMRTKGCFLALQGLPILIDIRMSEAMPTSHGF